ncbi:MAG: hypothetical protein ACRBBU_13675 [Pseudooceanicola sp.]
MPFRLATAVFVITTAAVRADIQPVDGQWSGTWTMISNTGCPPQMVQQISQLGASERSYSQPITFPNPFQPDALQGDFTWTKLAENKWHAVHTESSATGMGVISVVTQHVLTVLSPVTMTQDVNATVTFPKKLAEMAKMAGTECTWAARVDHHTP